MLRSTLKYRGIEEWLIAGLRDQKSHCDVRDTVPSHRKFFSDKWDSSQKGPCGFREKSLVISWSAKNQSLIFTSSFYTNSNSCTIKDFIVRKDKYGMTKGYHFPLPHSSIPAIAWTAGHFSSRSGAEGSWMDMAITNTDLQDQLPNPAFTSFSLTSIMLTYHLFCVKRAKSWNKGFWQLLDNVEGN
jgi:hypothetical protein